MKKEKNRKKAVAFILAAVVVVVVMFGFVIPSSAASPVDNYGLGQLDGASCTVDYVWTSKASSQTLAFQNKDFTLKSVSVLGAPYALGLSFSDGFVLINAQAQNLGYYVSSITFHVSVPKRVSSYYNRIYTTALQYATLSSATLSGSGVGGGSADAAITNFNGWDIWTTMGGAILSIDTIDFTVSSTTQTGLIDTFVSAGFVMYVDRGQLSVSMSDAQSAYQQGYLDADRRHANDYQNGYDAGYEASKPGIYQSGYDAGLETGYDEGVKVGYKKGEQDGYDRGVSLNSSDVNLELRKLLFSVVDTPVRAGLGFMNFEFLGYNLLQAFEAVMTVLFVGVCVYFVMKFI